MDGQLPVLVVVVPLFAALLIAVLGRRGRDLAWPIALLGTLAASAGCLRLLVLTAAGRVMTYRLGGWAAPTGIEYRVDRLAAIVLTMVACVAFLTVVWLRPGFRREIRQAARGSYLAVMMLFTAGLMGIAITADVFNLYVFLEISSITSYVLVAMGRRRQALYAGYTYLIIGSIGATFVLLGIGHLYMATGTLGMADLADRLPALADSTVVRTAFAFFIVGFAIKMALFPLHGWQPGAYTHAPSSASILLAATATKVAAYALYRVSFDVFGTVYLTEVLPLVRDGLAVMCISAIVIGPLLAVQQRDMKRLLAYSSVGQIGYVMLGLVVLDVDALAGSVFHLWSHAASKGALFCVAGALVYSTGSARLDGLAGLGRRAPLTGIVATVAGCSMVGIPLTGGFLTKWQLAVGGLEAGWWIVVPALLVSSVLTAAYVWRMAQRIWFAPEEVEPAVAAEVPWAMRLPALALAALCVVFGTTSFALDLARQVARGALG